MRTEKRVFRLKSGEWSVWNVQDGEGDVVGNKVTDLDLGYKIEEPFQTTSGLQQEASLRAAQQPWANENGVNFLSFDFYMGAQAHFQMYHRIDKDPGQMTMSGDEYFPLAGGKMV